MDIILIFCRNVDHVHLVGEAFDLLPRMSSDIILSTDDEPGSRVNSLPDLGIRVLPRNKTKEYNISIFFNNFSLKGCPTNDFKSVVGDSKCQRCPNGKTNNTMHTTCGCKKDHYIGENKEGPCYGMYLT